MHTKHNLRIAWRKLPGHLKHRARRKKKSNGNCNPIYAINNSINALRRAYRTIAQNGLDDAIDLDALWRCIKYHERKQRRIPKQLGPWGGTNKHAHFNGAEREKRPVIPSYYNL